jgi:hypothetical protein
MAAQRERQASLEHLTLQRRSTTVAALRRGTIKIGEPVLVENSGPSPVWPPYVPAIDKAGHPAGEGSDSEDESVDGKMDHDAALRHKRSSYLGGAEQAEPSKREQVTRSSMNESRESGGSGAATKRKRRSGSIRLAFRRMFSKRDNKQETSMKSTHEYHKSVSCQPIHMIQPT